MNIVCAMMLLSTFLANVWLRFFRYRKDNLSGESHLKPHGFPFSAEFCFVFALPDDVFRARDSTRDHKFSGYWLSNHFSMYKYCRIHGDQFLQSKFSCIEGTNY